MTALNTAAIEYTMGNTFAVGLAGEKIMYEVDDNNEVVPVAVVMVVIRPRTAVELHNETKLFCT